MSKNWTDKQKQAINSRNKTLLVSAAAGSGKTATLTERIVQKITEPDSNASIDRMLIVTYTRMSAADLKRKISEAISDRLAQFPTDKRLSKQLVLLENAHICTIDSFYLEIVRTGFQRLGLPSTFRIADEGEIALLRKNVMDAVIEKHYDAQADSDTTFLSFIENFTAAKQSDTLSDVFLSLESKLCSRTEGEKIILDCANELKRESNGDFFESRQGKLIREYILNASQSYYKAISACCDVIADNENASASYLAAFSYDKDFLEDLSSIIVNGTYSSVRDKFLSYSKQNLKSLKKEFQTPEILSCKAIRDEETKLIKALSEKYFSFTQEEISDSMLKTGDIFQSLYSVLNEFEKESLEEKIKRRTFDFNDIRRFAFKLLCDENGEASDIALSYRDKFDEIYIDEYQDVDAVQDKIFTLISKPENRFMVGDIKQSIYSFRGAEPDVFAEYKKSFPPIETADGSDNALIFMSNNFRCDKNVIDFTNRIFSFLFGNCGKNIGYTSEDNLIFSKVEEGRTLPSPKVKIALITGDESEGCDVEESEDKTSPQPNREAIWIANEISRLISSEQKADGSPIEPRDIAIIMRSVTSAADISAALDAVGIPCSDNSKYDLFETPDVMLVLSLLCTVDNPNRDIPLAATLYSPVFAYTMDELIEIRSNSDDSASLFEALTSYQSCENANRETVSKGKYFLEKLSLYRDKALTLPIDKLLNFIFSDLSLASIGAPESQNLTRLYEMSRKFESGSFKGLNNFISYINELIENKKIPSLSPDDSASNSVKLITAHKSKGLEFPVCFICNTQSPFNSDDIKPNLLYNAKAGIGLKLSVERGMARINTPIREAVALAISEAQTEEEMRILYVALTRARERLYITAHTNSRLDRLIENASLTSEFASDFRIKKCRSWLAMILASIYPITENDCYTLETIEKNAELDFDPITEVISDMHYPICEISDEKISEIKDRLNFEYPYKHLNRLPAKLSVSRLSPTVIDDLYDDGALLDSSDDLKILEIEEYFKSKSERSGADIGTATHLFLQFCNFENAERNGVEAELKRLTEHKFITEEIGDLIAKQQIERFFASNLYSTVKSAKNIWREQRFNIMLPASSFTENEELSENARNEKILIQGVIDLLIESENGEIILCDYKTDYLTPNELKNERLAKSKLSERHARQLSYYALAVKELLGRSPDKILIYSLPLGKAVEIEI